jgi:hypothetical protein
MRDSIREVAERVNDKYSLHKEGQCRKLSNKLCQALNEEGIEAEVFEGKVDGVWGSARHFFVRVYGEEEYIVDLSLSQFTEENANEYNWDTYIDESSIPEVVVTKEGEKWYDYYIL